LPFRLILLSASTLVNAAMTTQDALDDQRKLIWSLAIALEEEGPEVQFFETHLSWVIVTERFAYKFKKSVQFDFVDFSTLDARHFYCREELRLNHRLAPDLYLGVVSITGSRARPLIDAPGVPIEYAVKMHTFSQHALWSHRIKAGCISENEVDALAGKIARFHSAAAAAGSDSAWGTPNALKAIADDNLATIAPLVNGAEEKNQIREISLWQSALQQKLFGTFENRKTHGLIKECHGDLHGGNILTIDDRVEVFDCIEFNESLRWIDVINDIAFIYMDLQFQERHDLAARLLNQYLEITGDYEGVIVLRYYLVQRALVRCKVALLRAEQLRADAQEATSHQRQAAQYLSLAAKSIRRAPAAIMITHGYSGSGKSTLAKYLVELFGAVRIRSDVERKRMHGLAAVSRATAAPDAGLYAASATQMTYGGLCILARHVVESGMPVIVDAAFLKREQRELFEDLAHALRVPFFIFELRASEATIKERITARAQLGQDASDAGLAVLAHQIAQHDPLSEDELKRSIAVDSECDLDRETVRKIADPVVRVLQDDV
jgi:aminoglycoside phosphotransferase family enzyme/predicted kinase